MCAIYQNIMKSRIVQAEHEGTYKSKVHGSGRAYEGRLIAYGTCSWCCCAASACCSSSTYHTHHHHYHHHRGHADVIIRMQQCYQSLWWLPRSADVTDQGHEGTPMLRMVLGMCADRRRMTHATYMAPHGRDLLLSYLQRLLELCIT